MLKKSRKKWNGKVPGQAKVGLRPLYTGFLAVALSICSLGLMSLGGCSSPHLAPAAPSDRLGLFDKIGQLEPANQSSSIKEVAKGKSRRSSSKRGSSRIVIPDSEGLEGEAGLRWPLHYVKVNSQYGKRGRRFHEGIDLKAQVGTGVFASQSGKVLYAGSRIRGYGKMLVIRHKDGFSTVYAHNSKLLVKKGQTVHQGQQIALSGRTGRVTGPHLHFEIRKGVHSVDPLQVLPSEKSRSLALNP